LLAGILVLLPPPVPLRAEDPSTADLNLAGNRNAAPDKSSSNPGIPIPDQTIPYFLKAKAALYQQSPRTAALAWFDDARLGMFIHWGVWGKHHAAWAMFNQQIPLVEYQKLAREVDASGFNAAQIVKLAEDSGMHYITFVAKHHDGFCLWDSKATDWDSMDYPMHRDFVGELARACREREMPLFIYYSIGIDWTHPYYLPKELYSVGRPGYPQPPAHFKYRRPEDFEQYRAFCMQQLTELCTQYGPIAGFWFDTLGGVLANSEMFKMQEFYDLIYRYQPHALIHFKTGATGTEDVLVGERELKSIAMHYSKTSPQDQRIRKLADQAWIRNFNKKAEIAVTSQGTWEWSPDTHCQPVAALWRMLANAADNNANLLLNFGPKPDGSIPDDVATNFRLLGQQIRQAGYPALNRTNYLYRRTQGTAIDQTETEKTAR
jgi:alpha-L-fucosidase